MGSGKAKRPARYFDDTSKEDTVYEGHARRDKLRSGEIEPQEEAFLRGYDKADTYDDKDVETDKVDTTKEG